MKKCHESHEPNAETIAALEEAERIIYDDSVESFDNVEELMESLNKTSFEEFLEMDKEESWAVRLEYINGSVHHLLMIYDIQQKSLYSK